MKTGEVLGIFWQDLNGEHADVAGVTFYGFFPDSPVPNEALLAARIWSEQGHDTRIYELRWDEWLVLALDVKINVPPNDEVWATSVKDTLIGFVQHGAYVSWCGGELCLSTPLVFAEDGAHVYAAFSVESGLFCNARFSEEWRGLTDTQSAMLSQGLSQRFPDRCERARRAEIEWKREIDMNVENGS